MRPDLQSLADHVYEDIVDALETNFDAIPETADAAVFAILERFAQAAIDAAKASGEVVSLEEFDKLKNAARDLSGCAQFLVATTAVQDVRAVRDLAALSAVVDAALKETLT